MKKKFKIAITVLLAVILAVIIFYPKIKPLFASKSADRLRHPEEVREECRVVSSLMSADS